MQVIELKILINAPCERVFDISRSIDAHVATQTRHRERAVAGCTEGLIALGKEVTWEAIHFGIKQRLTSKIVKLDYPHHFRDSMTRGAFAGFDHDHYFDAAHPGTWMRDRFAFRAPLGPLGWVAEHLFLKQYMTQLLLERNTIIKEICESQKWRQFLADSV